MTFVIHIYLVSSIYWVIYVFVTLGSSRFTFISSHHRRAEDCFKNELLWTPFVNSHGRSLEVYDGFMVLYCFLFFDCSFFFFDCYFSPFWLSSQWLSRNSCTWIQDVRMITYILCSSCLCEIWALYVYVLWITYDLL